MSFNYTLFPYFRLANHYNKYITILESVNYPQKEVLRAKIAKAYNRDISEITLHQLPQTAGLSYYAAHFYRAIYLISLVVVAPLSLVSESFNSRRIQILNNYWILFKIEKALEPTTAPTLAIVAISNPTANPKASNPGHRPSSTTLLQKIERLLIFLFSLIKRAVSCFLPKEAPLSALQASTFKPLNVVSVQTSMSEEQALALFKLTKEEITKDPGLLKNTYEAVLKRLKSIQQTPSALINAEIAKMQENYTLAYRVLAN